MKSCKRTEKTTVKDIINESFMKSPFPMAITRAKDGKYVEVNESTVNFLGLQRKQIIGYTSTELGFLSAEQRRSFISEIKKNGYAVTTSTLINTKNQKRTHVLIYLYSIKKREETFFVSVVSDVSIQKKVMKKSQHDIFDIIIQDYKFVKVKLKQFHLTSRQQEIAILSAIGDSNREIAKKLCISLYTVKDHQKEIFRIIGIRNRSELFPKILNMR